MTLATKTASGTKSASAFKLRDNTGTLKTVQSGWVRQAAGLKQFFGKLTVSLSTTSVSGSSAHSTTGAVITSSVTATPVGGVGPFTYSWARTDGPLADWAIASPTSATTSFTCTLASGDSETATFACTITDHTGATSTSANVTAHARNVSLGIGGTM